MHRSPVHPRALASPRCGRLLLVLALVLLLPACDERAATQGAASTTATAGNFEPLHFSTDNPALGTEVGARTLGAGTTTTGRAGWLLFGPYAALPAGSYEAAVQGVSLPEHAGILYVDVAAEKGARVIAALELDPVALAAARSPDGMVVLPFTLDAPVNDIELRIRVTAQSQLAVSAIDIFPAR